MNRRTTFLFVCAIVIVAMPAGAFDLNLAVGADFGGDFDFGNISFSSDTGYPFELPEYYWRYMQEKQGSAY